MSAGQFIGILSLDNLVHTWDLAKATGQGTSLDPALTEACYGMFVPGLIDMARPHGAFGPVVSVPDSASTQDNFGIAGLLLEFHRHHGFSCFCHQIQVGSRFLRRLHGFGI